ncbi:GntR family transcriptional regulator [Streptomyces fulvoviolaceus]|uniref:GntR family transcriptional regulator n=1 Tax=Streptomyces fulvoviolaceus TaxID=285535 RepID=UPI0004CC097A|nr:GntR family transcriptional regulator [Streptomyces fulvoviolaceus]
MTGRPRVRLSLTDAERTTLKRWAGSRNTKQALALRARIVLACEATPGISGVAEELGVSRDTVVLWRSRFLADRLDALHDRPRTGRPRTVPDSAADEILRTMLRRPPKDRASWSTRSVAEATGLSQATVSRIWRTRWPGSPPAEAPVNELVGVYFGPALRALALRRPVDAPARVSRTGVPTVLAAAEYCRTPSVAVPGAAGLSAASVALRGFLARLDRTVPASVNIQVVVDATEWERGALSPALLSGWRRQHRFQVDYLATRSAWQAHVRGVIGVAEVADRIHGWRETGKREFAWIRQDLSSREVPWDGTRIDSVVHVEPASAARIPAPEPTPSPRLADQVVYALKEEIARGRFAAGERIMEAPLAARLGVSRGPVRDALRMLADDGLLELLPNKGAMIPVIHSTDVLETYASRAALGGVLLRRLATLDPSALRPVSAALEEARAAVRHGDMQVMVEADTVFQDAFADAARLPRTALHFRRLNMQLRMFASILGLDYADAGERVVRQDAAILAALRNRSAHEAVRHWRAKIEYMVRYMAAQLPQEEFDHQLWRTITGGLGESGL